MKLGIIGGTALQALAVEQPRAEAVDTPWGQPSAPLVSGRLGGCQVWFVNRHGVDHSLPPHRVNYRANIAALAQAGVEGILAVNAVGGISPAVARAGTWVVPDQLVDYTWGRSHSFCDGAEGTLQHIDFTEPYCPRLRRAILAAADASDLACRDGGTCAVTQGPRLETAAEIVRLERDGCDIVGMTSMPEAALAREKGIPYAALALVVNPAAGKGGGEITMDDIGRVMANSAPGLLALLESFCAHGHGVS